MRTMRNVSKHQQLQQQNGNSNFATKEICDSNESLFQWIRFPNDKIEFQRFQVKWQSHLK